MRSAALLLIAAAWGLYGSGLSFAGDAIPVCPEFTLRAQNGGNPGDLRVNNDEVLKWKTSTENQFHARGHVTGTIAKIYPDRNGHEHFSIKIGPNDTDTVEIIYNQSFGQMVEPRVGMPVEACGDYITSSAPSPGPAGVTYPASPDGALIHWVHLAPPRSGHHSGYVMINGMLTGQDTAHAGPRPPRRGRRGPVGPANAPKESNDGHASGIDFNSR
jgi:hypothetical protein